MQHSPDLPNLRRAVSIAAITAAMIVGTWAPAAQADEAQAREILKAMTQYLGAQQNLSFDVDSSLEIVTTDGQKLAIASSGSVHMQRPDKMHVMRQGGFADVEMIFDGKTLSVLNRGEKIFAQTELPGTIDQLVDKLRDEYHRPLPAADLLGADAEAVLLAEVTEVKDLGSGVIRGKECDHVAFRTPEVDWQMWIAQGETPHPCRFVITSKTVEGLPQYTLDFSAWGAGAADATFTFAAPEGAKKVEIKDIPDLDEIAGIYKGKVVK
ncbi:hypothetical protein SAMN05892877_12016 [Rhizobium subbaraonis]|uniref:Outer membrane lipoprotein-sorting protein n=1 Tax=Rhizobium subbaraonis TaxID=908946 RepID=A0A285UZ43_9HYPH|nr:DUF2092 domain-containing protein [Rhizobium subbaraonis]SOC46006.1 hypothetical protein SAMN05892877_12016 [Rhizobium subbaraonis]